MTGESHAGTWRCDAMNAPTHSSAQRRNGEPTRSARMSIRNKARMPQLTFGTARIGGSRSCARSASVKTSSAFVDPTGGRRPARHTGLE
jgi:hypothetical protein